MSSLENKYFLQENHEGERGVGLFNFRRNSSKGFYVPININGVPFTGRREGKGWKTRGTSYLIFFEGEGDTSSAKDLISMYESITHWFRGKRVEFSLGAGDYVHEQDETSETSKLMLTPINMRSSSVNREVIEHMKRMKKKSKERELRFPEYEIEYERRT